MVPGVQKNDFYDFLNFLREKSGIRESRLRRRFRESRVRRRAGRLTRDSQVVSLEILRSSHTRLQSLVAGPIKKSVKRKIRYQGAAVSLEIPGRRRLTRDSRNRRLTRDSRIPDFLS